MEKKIYDKKSEKIIDFIIGFILIPVFFGITTNLVSSKVSHGNYGPLVLISVLLIELVGVIYLCRKRKYMGIGLLFTLVVLPLVLLGTCLLIMGGGNMFGYLFR